MFLYPGMDNMAVVTFDQTFSNNLSNQMRKRQCWIKETKAGRSFTRGGIKPVNSDW